MHHWGSTQQLWLSKSIYQHTLVCVYSSAVHHDLTKYTFKKRLATCREATTYFTFRTPKQTCNVTETTKRMFHLQKPRSSSFPFYLSSTASKSDHKSLRNAVRYFSSGTTDRGNEHILSKSEGFLYFSVLKLDWGGFTTSEVKPKESEP